MDELEPRRSRPGRFRGGLRLRGHKAVSTREPIRVLPPPTTAIVPLQQHLGEVTVPCVSIGEAVLTGQPLTRTNAFVAAELNAPVSGRIVAIEDRPVPVMDSTTTRCVVIESDGEDRRYGGYEPLTSSAEVPVAKVIERVRQAGIAGLGGAVFPTHVKLTLPPEHPLEALIINVAECEPYISCDQILVRERAADVLTGAQVMMYALGVNRCLFAVENDKPDVIGAMTAALHAEGDDRCELTPVEAIYPAGAERQLIMALSGKEVPSRGLPPDVGFVCHNAGTAYAVKRAVLDGEPLISRIVTVTGPGIARPANLEARLGTPVSELIAACGGYADEVALLAVGGPMMGVALETDEVPVIKATNCILVLTENDLPTGASVRPCIRCGECARVCPAQLLPQQLYWHGRRGQLDRVLEYSVFDCIECGCCDLACPSHIPLTQGFRQAKLDIWARAQRHERWFGGAQTPDAALDLTED